MHDLHETMQWYRDNDTTAEIGFNPDGMCQKVCRTARDLPAVYSTAKRSQDATPKEHRFYKVADWRKGMVLYVDDPNDSNAAGHIVTIVGRVKGFDPDNAHDVLVKTNSVLSGRLVVVRADYFTDAWGDKIQFASDWLNGAVLDVFARQEKPPVGLAQVENFQESRPDWDVKILDRLGEKRPDVANKVKQIDRAVDSLPEDEKDTRVREFKEHYASHRELKLKLLNEAVREGRQGTVLEVRNNLRAVIKSLLPR